jgi:hypothetical protein
MRHGRFEMKGRGLDGPYCLRRLVLTGSDLIVCTRDNSDCSHWDVGFDGCRSNDHSCNTLTIFSHHANVLAGNDVSAF